MNANVGDAPQLMNALVSGYAELAIDDTYVYVLTSPGENTGATVNGVRKDNHQSLPGDRPAHMPPICRSAMPIPLLTTTQGTMYTGTKVVISCASI